jgi:phosphoglycerate-specific signal transduction histidine kinase
VTIDERLEALTHSMELLVSLHNDTERRLAEFITETRQGTADLRELVKQVVENNNRLSNIIIAHDEQLDDHEKRIDGLES